MPSPAQGSLHPASLLMLVFADVFGASDFHREFWGPPSIPWHDTIGQTGLYRRAEHRTGLHRRARRRVAVSGFGDDAWRAVDARGPLFHRGDVADAALRARQIHAGLSSDVRYLPGVTLYRRPADATFVLCALLAMIGGYLVHRWLTGTVPQPRRWQRVVASCHRDRIRRDLDRAGAMGRYAAERRAAAVLGLRICRGRASPRSLLARRLAARSAVAAAFVLAIFCVADLGWNNAPNELTGLHAIALRGAAFRHQ